jgi:hypothetical protein
MNVTGTDNVESLPVSLGIVVSNETGEVDCEERSGSYSSTSFFVILPPGPEPDTLARLMRRSSAMRRAIGVASIRPVDGPLMTSVVSWNCSGSSAGSESSVSESLMAVVC